MINAWGTLAFLIVLSSFVPYITCPESETTGTTKPAETTTAKDGGQQTPARRCIDLYILRPIRWLVVAPLKMFWDTMAKAKESLASLYGFSAPKPNEPANKSV